ncbi:hypothetical protein [Streptomyces wuyuanensis]|uniref:hypothetical protein n=1 Tax=Streptomyces wuyuanensis TaxID=1196353 RepID=UPI0034268E85
MTDHEFRLVLLGFQLGALFVLLTDIAMSVWQVRRADRAAKAVAARHAKWCTTDGWRAALTIPEEQ